MKIAILGGSFNPVHNGHLELARCAVEDMKYDKVLFVPTNIPPHKDGNFGISDAHRLKMLSLAVESVSETPSLKNLQGKLDFEPCEIQRGGVSYTFDTVKFLMNKYRSELENASGKNEKIGVILGTDLYSTFHLWHKARELSEIADLILAKRPEKENFEGEKSFSKSATGEYAVENSTKKDVAKKACEEDFPFPHKTMENVEIVASSSAIRMACAKKLDFSSLVPENVEKYIKENALYEVCG